MSETPGVTKNEGIQKLLEAEKEATKIVDEARQRKLTIQIGAERTQMSESLSFRAGKRANSDMVWKRVSAEL